MMQHVGHYMTHVPALALSWHCREMQQHVAALQAELKAAQAAADLEATEKEFMSFIGNGQHLLPLSCATHASAGSTGAAAVPSTHSSIHTDSHAC
jgi:hypothetical protein